MSSSKIKKLKLYAQADMISVEATSHKQVLWTWCQSYNSYWSNLVLMECQNVPQSDTNKLKKGNELYEIYFPEYNSFKFNFQDIKIR